MLGRDISLFESFEKSIRLYEWVASVDNLPSQQRSKVQQALSKSMLQRERLIAESMRNLRKSSRPLRYRQR